MSILCLDYGNRYVGLAIADAEDRIALRFGVIDQKKEDVFERLIEIIKQEKVEEIIVGVPRSLSGEDSEQTRFTREFVEDLRMRLKIMKGMIGMDESIDVNEVDERFTSKEARRIILAEGGNSEDEHSEAARLMLESYLKTRK